MSENTSNENTKETVVVYGSADCPYTARARKWLEAWNIDYRWVDVDENADAEKQIADWNEGRAIRPTIDIKGAIFINPEQSVLHNELETRGLL